MSLHKFRHIVNSRSRSSSPTLLIVTSSILIFLISLINSNSLTETRGKLQVLRKPVRFIDVILVSESGNALISMKALAISVARVELLHPTCRRENGENDC